MSKIKLLLSIIIAIVIIIIIILFGISHYQKNLYDKVKMGITMEEAKKITDEKSNYVIVSIDESTYKCETGKYKGKYVKLLGEKGSRPDLDCSNVLEWPEQNKFLIKIKNVKENFFDDGLCHIDFDITCDGYDFIIPIKREYCYSKHKRYFYPKDYIDEYDVMHGDYKK